MWPGLYVRNRVFSLSSPLISSHLSLLSSFSLSLLSLRSVPRLSMTNIGVEATERRSMLRRNSEEIHPSISLVSYDRARSIEKFKHRDNTIHAQLSSLASQFSHLFSYTFSSPLTSIDRSSHLPPCLWHRFPGAPYMSVTPTLPTAPVVHVGTAHRRPPPCLEHRWPGAP